MARISTRSFGSHRVIPFKRDRAANRQTGPSSRKPLKTGNYTSETLLRDSCVGNYLVVLPTRLGRVNCMLRKQSILLIRFGNLGTLLLCLAGTLRIVGVECCRGATSGELSENASSDPQLVFGNKMRSVVR